VSCHHCGATTSNGLALCDLCRRKVSTDLEFVPIYFRNLARWKPGRAGSRPVPGSRLPAGALGSGLGEDKVIRALDEAHNMITTRARMLVDDRPGFVRPLTFADAVLTGDLPDQMADDQAWVMRWLCWVLDERLTTIATLDWAGDLVRDLSEHEQILRQLAERVAPGWYAGACRNCDEPTYVIQGFTWVTCNSCGATTYARDHLDVVLSEARGWVAPPRRMAEAIVALVDTEASVQRLDDRIRQWGKRGKLVVHRAVDEDGDEVGPKRYWFGEVLDRLITEGATRVADVTEVEAVS
jgi:hypothetical protein